MPDLNVRKEAVIRALKEKGITVLVDNDLTTVTNSDGVAEVYAWPDELSQNMLRRISRKYGVSMSEFWKADKGLLN